MFSWRNLAGIQWPVDPEYRADQECTNANIKMSEDIIDVSEYNDSMSDTHVPNTLDKEPPTLSSDSSQSTLDNTQTTNVTKQAIVQPTIDIMSLTSLPRGRSRSRWGPKITDPNHPRNLKNTTTPSTTTQSTTPSVSDFNVQPQTREEVLRLAALRAQSYGLGPCATTSHTSDISLTPEQQQHITSLKIQIGELTTKMANPSVWLPPERERSPSPDPIYDASGKRLNTREYRLKLKFQKERNSLIEEVQVYEPSFTVAGYKKELPSMKILLPVDEYPDQNFHGLIIGPRGNTQKKLEKETGCKISVRGRPANSDIKSKKRVIDDNDDPYVFIQGETIEDVEKAVQIIRQLIEPKEEGLNEHKLSQLRELAELNGLPQQQRNLRAAVENQRNLLANKLGVDSNAIECKVCGSTTHLTIDCPKKTTHSIQSGGGSTFDAEYDEFMNQVYNKTTTTAPVATDMTTNIDSSYMSNSNDMMMNNPSIMNQQQMYNNTGYYNKGYNMNRRYNNNYNYMNNNYNTMNDYQHYNMNNMQNAYFGGYDDSYNSYYNSGGYNQYDSYSQNMYNQNDYYMNNPYMQNSMIGNVPPPPPPPPPMSQQPPPPPPMDQHPSANAS